MMMVVSCIPPYCSLSPKVSMCAPLSPKFQCGTGFLQNSIFMGKYLIKYTIVYFFKN